MKDRLKNTLMDAYANPGRKACFYTAHLKKTGSSLLDGKANWDWLPEYSHEVKGDNTCIFPLGLGARRIEIGEDKKEWAEPMFSDSDTEYSLELPDVWDNKTGEMLREVERMAAELPEGELIREPDIQSPLGVAEILCGQGLYLALLVNPDSVHSLLDKITSFIITFINELRKVAGYKLNGACFPRVWNNSEGTLVSDDTISLLSPEQHREFSIPYITRIAEECGPLFYHACTWSPEYFENIKSLPNVRAVNWQVANSCSAELIVKEFSGRAVLAPHLYPGMHEQEGVRAWSNFSDEVEMVKFLLDIMQDNTTYYFWLAGFEENPLLLERIYRLLKENGHTPHQYFREEVS